MMKTSNLNEKPGYPGGKRGVVLVVALAFMALLIFGVTSLALMIQTDAGFVKKTRDMAAARFAAEAGINHALANLDSSTYEAISGSTITNDTSAFTAGSYLVTFSEPSAGRYLATSVGTANGETATATMEIRPASAAKSATDFFAAAAGNVQIKVHNLSVDGYITGGVHANGNLTLTVQPRAAFTLTGPLSACGTVNIDNKGTLVRSGTNTNGAPFVAFPTFKYAALETLAKDSGNYYSGNTTLTGVQTPANGVIYINGTLTVSGNCTIYGGVVANSILVPNGCVLTQYKSGTRNLILARTGEIRVQGRLDIKEALVYAEGDILTHQKNSKDADPEVYVLGGLIAKGSITFWNEKNHLQYTRVEVSSPEMNGVNTRNSIVSWNK
ncbi:MAG: hypothetical protein HQL30_11060 [Candidatus Omnitrophica bacterium]|nr:hypothetical protein [Candidatus Omnitrophota bacterium]